MTEKYFDIKISTSIFLKCIKNCQITLKVVYIFFTFILERKSIMFVPIKSLSFPYCLCVYDIRLKFSYHKLHIQKLQFGFLPMSILNKKNISGAFYFFALIFVTHCFNNMMRVMIVFLEDILWSLSSIIYTKSYISRRMWKSEEC